ncbi:hypothetical protein RN001_013896 [Aquatica leii]|uniref:Uncharacterized protein n=1 Tax=Aquatica leii TaxID=1421715 RepID=A0AAN7P527_9COLE|nr:hypothetical protein RN001_013896 [Aquatica leii]
MKNFSSISTYLSSYSDFHQHNFKIGYISFIPFFWCRTSLTDCTGPEANLLQLLSTKLNFQYTLVNFEDAPSGAGKWKTLVNAVHNKTLDWGIGGISLSPERSSLTDLSRVIHSEAYTILYHCPVSETWNSWKQVFKPFSFLLWACIGFAFIGIIFLLKYLPDTTKPSTVKNVEVLVRGLFEQPLRRLPFNAMGKRLVFIGWLYTCIILITAYKSKVVSMMIDSQYEEFESIQELLYHGYTFQVSNQDWSVLKENWEASAKLDKSFYEILKKTSSNQSTCDAVDKMLKNKVAYIDETSTMLYQVSLCPSFIIQEPSSQLCLIDKQVSPSYHIWPMQIGAAYRHRFSYVIENLHSAGILSFWYNSVLEKLRIKTSSNRQAKSTSGLTLTTMTSSLFILGFGLGVSVVLFVFELIYYYSDTISNYCKKYSF